MTEHDDNTDLEYPSILQQLLKLVFVIVVSIGVLSLLLVLYLARPPAAFPITSQLEIESGSNVTEIVEQFKQKGYVRSANLLYLSLIIQHDARDIKAGIYSFTEPTSVFETARLITEVGPKDDLVKITIPEGVPVSKIAVIAAKLLPFDEVEFVTAAQKYEGQLFPDTYFVPKNYTLDQFLQLLLSTHSERTASLINTEAVPNDLTPEEVLIFASILEREANSPESMKLVSSVLHNRLAIGMALQTDATIEYILNKPLSELTPEDLKIDSPYNTYLNTGLPPTPIGNPGLVAVEAALHPEASEYLFYITGTDGRFYFAKTFAEHKENIARYLR